MVHSKEDYETALEASQILFGKGTKESLTKIDENTFLSVFDGVPMFDIESSVIEEGITVTDLLVEKTNIFPSKGEFRRMQTGGGLSINKEKVDDLNLIINREHLLNKKYILIQKGKKNYNLIRTI